MLCLLPPAIGTPDGTTPRRNGAMRVVFRILIEMLVVGVLASLSTIVGGLILSHFQT
jgi:hypothetical protein